MDMCVSRLFDIQTRHNECVLLHRPLLLLHGISFFLCVCLHGMPLCVCIFILHVTPVHCILLWLCAFDPAQMFAYDPPQSYLYHPVSFSNAASREGSQRETLCDVLSSNDSDAVKFKS